MNWGVLLILFISINTNLEASLSDLFVRPKGWLMLQPKSFTQDKVLWFEKRDKSKTRFSVKYSIENFATKESPLLKLFEHVNRLKKIDKTISKVTFANKKYFIIDRKNKTTEFIFLRKNKEEIYFILSALSERKHIKVVSQFITGWAE